MNDLVVSTPKYDGAVVQPWYSCQIEMKNSKIYHYTLNDKDFIHAKFMRLNCEDSSDICRPCICDKTRAWNTYETIRLVGQTKGKLKQLTSIRSLDMTHKSTMSGCTRILIFRRPHTIHTHHHYNMEGTCILAHALESSTTH